LTVNVAAVVACEIPSGMSPLRPARHDDRAAVNAAHARANANAPGTLIHEGHPAEPPLERVLMNDEGYVSFERRDDALVASVNGHGAEFHLCALRALSHVAREQGLSRLLVEVPPEHPVSRVARLFGARHTTHYRRGGFRDARALGPAASWEVS